MPHTPIRANSPTPIRDQLRALLLKDIEAAVHKPGDRFPSERALAEQFGISRPSVREAITQLLSEGYLFRTVRGTFVTERPRRQSGACRQIGFWISASIFQFVQAGYDQILTGAGEVCRERGYGLQFHAMRDGAPADAGVYAAHDAGLVVGGVDRGVMDHLQETGAPLLLVDLLVADDDADCVRIDYAAGIRQAVEHLAGLGHTTIGFVGFPGSQKYEAFWQSLEACGIAYHPRHVQFLSVSDLMPGMLAGYRVMQKWIACGPLPGALLVTNDYVSLGILEALAIAGLRVPDEISVIGCDDLGLGSRPLTTIRVDLAEVGRVAANALIDRIEQGADPPRRVLVPVELIIRGTTGPPGDRSLAAAAE